jgi:hypothetical protein
MMKTKEAAHHQREAGKSLHKAKIKLRPRLRCQRAFFSSTGIAARKVALRNWKTTPAFSETKMEQEKVGSFHKYDSYITQRKNNRTDNKAFVKKFVAN